jgi:predicted dehydrogenase
MPRTASPPYRVGLVGINGPAGGIAGEHARAVESHPKAKLVAICDINPAGFEGFCERHGSLNAYTDVTAMFETEEIDIVCVGTSDHTHCDIVEAACRAGVPMIFCEKPLDVTLERGDRMVRAVEEAGVTFLCDHTRRWTPTWVRAKKILVEHLGAPVRARAHMADPRAMLFRNGTHVIDALCWFVGDEPAWVTGGEFEDLGVFDPDPSFTVLLGFRGGCRAFLDFTKKSSGDLEIDCVCEGGRLTLNRAGIHLTRREEGLGMTYAHLPSSSGESSGIAHAMRDLIEAYEEGRPTRSTARDALRVLEIITAIVRSHDGGGARVDWPLDRDARTASEGKLGFDPRTLEWQKG